MNKMKYATINAATGFHFNYGFAKKAHNALIPLHNVTENISGQKARDKWVEMPYATRYKFKTKLNILRLNIWQECVLDIMTSLNNWQNRHLWCNATKKVRL